jgi:CxxC motif-containing protein (DUF1111 family)
MRKTWFLGGLGLAGVGVLVLTWVSVSAGDGPPRPRSQPAPVLGGTLPGLTADQLARFSNGVQQFLEVEDLPGGLGPVFTESACVTCHNAGANGGAGQRLETRIGALVNGQYDPLIAFGGPLIQNQGIGLVNGVNFVGEVVPPQATIVAQRRTTPLFELGLVDAVPNEELKQIALEEGFLNPRTAGQVGIVVEPAAGPNVVGRFGWKAQHSNLFGFTGDAYQNEMGVTTPLDPDENCPQGNCALLVANPALTNPNDPDNSAIQAFTDFVTMLAPPPRGPVGPSEHAGHQIFLQIGCADCHRPTLLAGPSPFAAINGAPFHPFSDFLLHDMGALGDGIVQNQAGPRQMRTAPLWGLRFQPSLLHDGRTTSIPDAILQHDGQGRFARHQFSALGQQEQDQLVAFLKSL